MIIGRIYWFLRGSAATPSSRIHGINVHKYLLSKGYDSHLMCAPLKWLYDFPYSEKSTLEFVQILQSNDIVIVQKFEGVQTLRFLQQLKGSKASIVYLDSDAPVKASEALYADWVICPSEFLSGLYRNHHFSKVKTIPDAVELFIKPDPSKKRTGCLVWYGRDGEVKWNHIQRLEQLVKQSSLNKTWKFVTISNSRKATYKWNFSKSFHQIQSCDAIVLPVFSSDEASYAKSVNRVTQGMALGIPVLASPIPSYKEVIANGVTGFLCAEDADWIENIKRLKDEKMRNEMAENAFRFVKKKYSIETIGQQWISFFQEIQVINNPVLKDRGSAFVLTYLKLTMNWILMKKEMSILIKGKYFFRVIKTLFTGFIR